MNNLSSFLWLLITNKFRIFPTHICIFTCTVLYDQLSFLLRCLGLFLIRNRWLLQIIKKAVSYFKESMFKVSRFRHLLLLSFILFSEGTVTNPAF